MGENSTDFREALGELVETTYPEPADHPSAEAWMAYLRGELADGLEARFEEHLVRCRDCCDLVQAAEAFATDEEPAPGDEVADEVESAALWRLLRERLFKVRPFPAVVTPRAWQQRLPYALAASLFVAMVGLTGWNLQQQSALARLRAPKPNPVIADFAAGERLALSGAEERKLAAGTGPWVLVFHPDEELPDYRLVIRDTATGREQYAVELTLDDDLALSLHLPEGLRPGLYALELSDGAGGGTGKILQKDLLRVTEGTQGD